MIRRMFWAQLLLLLPFCAQALGIGELSVSSFLDQPLRARVALSADPGLQAEEVRASLASEEVFRKAGVARPFSLSGLRFKTVVSEAGSHLEITTREAVREPYLNFLLEITWQGSTLVKEFTILLDPPVYLPAASAPSTPAAAPAPATVTNRAAAVTAPAAATYGPVKRSETLWVIASKTRPDGGYTVEQMMMALQRVNPDAFRQDNVNLLRQGVVLSIPDRDLIGELSPADARRAFARQTREWRELRGQGRTARVAAPVEQQAQVQAPPAQRVLREVAEVPKAPADELQVVAPDPDWQPAAGNVSRESYPVREEEKLREAIADSASDLAAVKEINKDLEELRDVLEGKIAALRASLEERDRTIEELVKRLEETAARADRSADAQPAVAQQQPPSPAVDSRLAAAQAQPQPEPAAAQPTLSQSRWLPLAVVGVLAAVLLAAAWARRRKSGGMLPEPDAFESFLQPVAEPQIDAPRAMPQTLGGRQNEQEEQRDQTEQVFGADMDVSAALTEADVYLAYRRYTQAENLVREAIKHNPQSMILCAKLLEIYAFRKDRKKFTMFMEDTSETMIAKAPGIWAKVVEMGRDLIPRHPLIANAVLPEEAGSGGGKPLARNAGTENTPVQAAERDQTDPSGGRGD